LAPFLFSARSVESRPARFPGESGPRQGPFEGARAFIDQTFLPFFGFTAKKNKRNVVFFKKKRKICWHLAPFFFFFLSDPIRLIEAAESPFSFPQAV